VLALQRALHLPLLLLRQANLRLCLREDLVLRRCLQRASLRLRWHEDLRLR
jgi:hypothetical protein